MSKKRSILLLFVWNIIIVQSIIAQAQRTYLFPPVDHQEQMATMIVNGTTLSVTVRTVVTTNFPVMEIEIPEHDSSTDGLDIYLREGSYDNRTGTISHVHKGTTWSYEPVYSVSDHYFIHLASRTLLSDQGAFELVVAHDSGLTLLSKNPQEEEWSNHELLTKDNYKYPYDLITADIDPRIEGEEILFIYEDPSIVLGIRIANFYLFSYNDSWVKQLIYQENPVTTAAFVGEFNTSNDETEIVSLSEGGIVTLLQYQKGRWKGERLTSASYGPPFYRYFDGVVADFYPGFLGDEFATGVTTSNKEFIAIFSNKTGNWEPEIIPLGNKTKDSDFITDLAVVGLTDSETEGIIAVDTLGNVWLTYLTTNGWNVVKLYQDTAALHAVQVLSDSNSIIVGGESRNLTEITSDFFSTPSTTTTSIRSNTATTWETEITQLVFSFFSPGMGVLLIIIVGFSRLYRKKRKQ